MAEHQLKPKEALQGTAWGVVLHVNGWAIAAGSALWFWSLEKGENIFTLKLPGNGRDLAISPERQRLAIRFADGSLRVYHLA